MKLRLHLRALAAMDDGVIRIQGWLRRVAGEMVRERVKARCAELGVNFALADTRLTTALTYAACRPVYKMVKACGAAPSEAS